MPKVLLEKTSLIRKLDAQGFTNELSLKSNLAYFQMTHLGPSGSPLDVTGQQDEDTLWALSHPTGKAQKSNLVPKIPDGLLPMQVSVLVVALVEHAKGVKEHPNGSNRSKEIDKYFPQWLQRKLKPGQKGPPWCCYFVNWVSTQSCGRPWGGYIGSCKRLVESAKATELCRVFTDPALAAPGDIFVILHGTTGHTGFVLKKDKQDSQINTVEGNCGNRVKVGQRQTKDITCYISVIPNAVMAPGELLAVADVGREGTR